MLSNYQLKIADFFNIAINEYLLEIRIEAEETTSCIEIESITMVKALLISTHKK